MNVAKLREFIQDLPDDMQVILQKDAEGNGYSPLQGCDADAIYVPETTWSGEVFDSNWSADEACMTQAEWGEFRLQKRSLILFPVN